MDTVTVDIPNEIKMKCVHPVGTSGSSSDQLRKALGYSKVNSDDDVVNEAYRKVMKWMRDLDNRSGAHVTLKVANGLFSEKSLLKEYSTKVKQTVPTKFPVGG